MNTVLLHTCCAPCSLSCIEPLRAEGIEPVAFWYNPNIHPWTEYKARRDCLLEFAPTIGLDIRVQEDYGLRSFVESVGQNIDNRCQYCYAVRLAETAKYAANHGFEAFTTTLLSSLYQDHEAITALGYKLAQQHGIQFYYRDFRSNFRAGNQKAKDDGFYIQKYCGCIFSEADRYDKKIQKDKIRFAPQEEPNG
ncbi:epoxyqueuosine reductase QueH [Bengtsoniella intestinalis]|uniref:epoxyqueuosine reductase QueH n=1 Tax=Bengtsoniella intestinalis TaxID=3073143 RepID=UPI00391F50B2